MNTGYFEFSTAQHLGFTIRILYEERYGVITIPADGILLRSTVYGGYYWYPHGEIKVGDEVILSMNHYAPATHQFSFGAPSDDWIPIEAIHDGVKLPVSATAIRNTTQVTMSADLLLYHPEVAGTPMLNGSTIIDLTTGFTYIRNETLTPEPYSPYVWTNGKWEPHMTCVREGDEYTICG